MKTRSLVLIVAAGGTLAAAAGCFPGVGDVRGNHRNNDAPIVVTDTPATLGSLSFDLTFTAYDPDSESVTLWDVCPYDIEGATPPLRISYSANGGSSFSKIDPADIELDGAPLMVPTCKQVRKFDESIRIAVSTSGEQHTITWNSLPYVPSAATIIFRVAVNDGSFTSEPGDTDAFPVANLPGFSVQPLGARPGETLAGATLSGLLTHWDVTTAVGSADNVTVTNFVASSTTAATADITMGGDTAQVPRYFELVTPGQGVPSGDEVATGFLWTCNVMGQPVVELETDAIGGGAQFICSQPNTWQVDGSLYAADDDFYRFVAGSSGDLTFSLNWGGGGGDVDDYDAYIFDPAVGLTSCSQDLLGCACATVNKPETGTITGLVAGRTYILYISHYAGAELPYTANVAP